MPGFYGVANHDGNSQPLNRFMFSSTFASNRSKEIRFGRKVFGYCFNDCFSNDKFIKDSENYIVGFDGCVVNELNPTEYLISCFDNNNIKLLDSLDGVYRGFCYNKLTNRIFLFVDHLSTRPIYYSILKKYNVFVFGGELKFVSHYLRNHNISVSPNYNALENLLTFGCIFKDETPIIDINKILPGECIEIDLSTLRYIRHQYSYPFFEEECKDDYKHILHNTKYYLENAIHKYWNYEAKHIGNHLATLSGGMDSRINLMLAHKMGFTNIKSFTFSNSNSADRYIASQIADEIGSEHQFINLDGGRYLYDSLWDNICLNDGINRVHGAAHLNYSLKQLKNTHKGFIQTGQIGGLLFGSFQSKESVESGIYNTAPYKSDRIFKKNRLIKETLTDYSKDPMGFQKFLLYQRQVNFILNGDRVTSYNYDLISPYYDRKLLRYTFSIPMKHKNHQKLLIDMLNKYYPEVCKIKWEKSKVRPTSYTKHMISHNIVRFYNKYIYSYNSKSANQHWYENNNEIDKNYHHLYNNLINYIEDDELKYELKALYSNNNLISKSHVISVIGSYYLHFICDPGNFDAPF